MPVPKGRAPYPETQPWISRVRREDDAPFYSRHTYGSYWHRWATRPNAAAINTFDQRHIADGYFICRTWL
jgi:hypothetical protein